MNYGAVIFFLVKFFYTEPETSKNETSNTNSKQITSHMLGGNHELLESAVQRMVINTNNIFI